MLLQLPALLAWLRPARKVGYPHERMQGLQQEWMHGRESGRVAAGRRLINNRRRGSDWARDGAPTKDWGLRSWTGGQQDESGRSWSKHHKGEVTWARGEPAGARRSLCTTHRTLRATSRPWLVHCIHGHPHRLRWRNPPESEDALSTAEQGASRRVKPARIRDGGSPAQTESRAFVGR